MSIQALLFDTRSIQKYIFLGNRLKTNIGASYIVDHVFEEVLLKKILPDPAFGFSSIDTTSWKTKSQPLTELPADCYVAYIGGGNALILFKKQKNDSRKAIVTAFTKELLVHYPGLKTGAAMGDMDLSSKEAFHESRAQLYLTLKENQNTVFPQVNIPYTGLTLDCEVNGEAANFYDDHHLIVKEGPGRFFSQEVRAKTAAAETANRHLQDLFADHLARYSFPTELDCLGQRESESDIAIIHIDGNQMGKRFSECQTLMEQGQLSYKVRKDTERAFAALLDTIIEEYDSYRAFLDLEEGLLPIRPLILGGDDITFICPARLALTYTERFMKALQSSFSSCAGIAILPTAYPFFRGYTLAEQACDAAKAQSRNQTDSCWLDFVILHGEQAPELEQIRQEEYRGALGNMHFGPYRVDDDHEEHALAKLLDCAKAFMATKNSKDKNTSEAIPMNKVKELRFVAQQGRGDIQIYLEQLRHLNLRLPHIPGWERFESSVWDRKQGAVEAQTPYVDAIEIMDYIPIQS